ncbi:hypothetical protein HDU67_006876 [Dinochytrium kinnereticum]|nr:hypothetical protein HDU67_006876 [Dinochytrium kinnereticum]
MVAITELPDASVPLHQRKGRAVRAGKGQAGKGKDEDDEAPLLGMSEEEQMRIINEADHRVLKLSSILLTRIHIHLLTITSKPPTHNNQHQTGILHKLKSDPRWTKQDQHRNRPSNKPPPEQDSDTDSTNRFDDGEDDETDDETPSQLNEDDDETFDPTAPIPEPPVIPTAIILTIPLITLHQILDYAVHHQFSSLSDYTLSRSLTRIPPLALALFMIICLTSGPRRNLVITQLLLAIASATCGCMVVKYSEGMETFGNMLRTPGLATLWVYAVIQLRLDLAVISLGVPLCFYFREYLFLKSQLRDL